MSTRRPTATTIDLSALARAVIAPLGKADADRAANLASLASAHVARGYMMKRVRDARAARLGPAVPEVAALDAALAANSELATALAMEGTLATKSPPVAAAGETVVYGFVRDATGMAVEGVKLTVVPARGKTLDDAESARDGYFVLRFTAAREHFAQLELRVHDKRHPDPIDLDLGDPTTFVLVQLGD